MFGRAIGFVLCLLLFCTTQTAKAEVGTPTGTSDGRGSGDSSGVTPIPGGGAAFAAEARDGAPDDAPPNTDTCFGPPEQAPADVVIEVPWEEETIDANKKRVTKLVLSQQSISTFNCNGRPFAQVKRCIKNCPPAKPRTPTMRVSSAVRRAILRGIIKLPPVAPVFIPKTSNDAPIVGMRTFYGISQQQWNFRFERSLQVCIRGEEVDCAAITLKIKPTAVWFDPKRARTEPTGLRKTCERPIPTVKTGDDAQREGLDCAVIYNDSGTFTFAWDLPTTSTTPSNDGASSNHHQRATSPPRPSSYGTISPPKSNNSNPYSPTNPAPPADSRTYLFSHSTQAALRFALSTNVFKQTLRCKHGHDQRVDIQRNEVSVDQQVYTGGYGSKGEFVRVLIPCLHCGVRRTTSTTPPSSPSLRGGVGAWTSR
jgi:hypothetical protein